MNVHPHQMQGMKKEMPVEEDTGMENMNTKDMKKATRIERKKV